MAQLKLRLVIASLRSAIILRYASLRSRCENGYPFATSLLRSAHSLPLL